MNLYQQQIMTKLAVEHINTKEDKCSICMHIMTQCVILECGHIFHHQCIKELFCVYLNDKCPMCRERFAYQPSKHYKPMKRLRKRMIKYNSNDNNLLEREKVADMHYFFKRHKVKVHFIKKITDLLQKDVNYDYDYVMYNKKDITLFLENCPITSDRRIYLNQCDCVHIHTQVDEWKFKFNECMEELKYSCRIEYITESGVPELRFAAGTYNGAPYYYHYRDSILGSHKNWQDANWYLDDEIYELDEESGEPLVTENVKMHCIMSIKIGRTIESMRECVINHWSVMDRLVGGQCRICENFLPPLDILRTIISMPVRQIMQLSRITKIFNQGELTERQFEAVMTLLE